MGRTTALRREIKKTFLPHVAKKGFVCDMRYAPQFFTFRKITPDAVYIFDIQWEKYGRPRFVVNFGKCGPKGVVQHGKPILPDDLFPYSGSEQGRLSPRRYDGIGGRGWFRQDRPLLQRLLFRSKLREPSDVIAELMTMFAELEALWAGSQPGKHIRIFSWPASMRPQDIA
jgi:hypothetical protein